ncbi:MAG: F0F1 ATP synthase subunit A [Planctomycetaceae bacterium]|nr:F0F1 ATP synthase subunit A [Planctomycetaceae bacterium]
MFDEKTHAANPATGTGAEAGSGSPHPTASADDGDSKGDHPKDVAHEHPQGSEHPQDSEHEGAHDYLSPDHLFSHVQDSTDFHFSPTLARMLTGDANHNGHIHLPHTGIAGYQVAGTEPYLKPLDFKLTRFMVIELLAAVLVFVVFAAVARRLRSSEAPRGRFLNMIEAMIQFIRVDIAKSVIGKKDGAKFAPFLLTLFFFVLGCNLLGMIPVLGTPTGDFAVTATLAFIVFFVVVKAGIEKFGPGGFLLNLVPSMDLPPAMKVALLPLIFVIEVMGFLIKHFVLAVRLFANMMAGHLVLAVIVAFIGATYGTLAHYMVVPASVLGATAISVLELFVAFLQAYVFTFLAALFISSATHHH